MAGADLSGRYWPVSSFWHSRDPRTNLGLVTGVLFLIISFAEIKTQAIWTGLLFALYLSARLPFRRLIGNLKTFRWLIILTFLANLFFVRGTRTFSFLPFLTEEGLAFAVQYSLRLVNLLLASFWLMMIVRPLDLIASLEKLLRPLRRWLPIGEFALAMGLAIRFFPLILEESEEIKMAQQARGGSRRPALTNLVTLVVPLFVGVVRRSGELAEAMETRGYHPGVSRTDWRGSSWNVTDTVTLLASWSALLILAFVISK